MINVEKILYGDQIDNQKLKIELKLNSKEVYKYLIKNLTVFLHNFSNVILMEK